jgi:hypothetical protein
MLRSVSFTAHGDTVATVEAQIEQDLAKIGLPDLFEWRYDYTLTPHLTTAQGGIVMWEADVTARPRLAAPK